MLKAIESVVARTDIAVHANEECMAHGAPRLTPYAPHAQLIAWLRWNDPNGEYLPEGHEDAYTIGECWGEIAEQVEW